VAQDQLTLFQMALSAIGLTRLPSDPDENTPGAIACRLWYEPVRNYVLRSAFWPSAKKAARLELNTTRDTGADWADTDPLPGWLYMYDVPEDLCAPRFLSTYERFETGITSDEAPTRVILTDMEDAILVYTSLQDDISLYDVGLYFAIAHTLSAYICQGLTGKNQKAVQQMQLANSIILQARADAANEMWSLQDSVPDWIAARGYSGDVVTSRFVYPYGPALSAPGAPLV
jgi:hypothetical protein